MSGRRARRHKVVLLAVLLSGAILRLWYGSWGLHGKRFWDERYALQNVESILVEHTLKPAISYYPSPLFNLPAALVVGLADRGNEALGRDGALIYDGVFGPEAYLLLRWLQALYGVVAVWLIYRVGRRLFTPEVGLAAATALAFSPWGIHSSGTFKPDAFLLMAVLAAFDLGLSCVRRPTPGRAVAAGAGVALAVSAKLTGALVAVPLAIGLLWPGRDGETAGPRRRWGSLALAGVSSIALFFATNPYGWWYPHWVSSLKQDYAMRAGWQEATHLEIPLKTLGLVPDRATLGVAFGGAALIGLAWLTVLLAARLTVPAMRRGGSPAVRELAMFVTFPWIYTAAYATQTSYFKENNLLPVVAFAAIAGAWLVVRLVVRAAARLGRPKLVYFAWVALFAIVAPPGFRYVYTSLVPACYDIARLALRPKPHAIVPQTIYRETGSLGSGWAWEGQSRLSSSSLAEVEVPDLTAVPVAWVGGADALVFPATRESSMERSPHAALLTDGRPARVTRFDPEPFRARGPGVVVWQRTWQPRRPIRKASLVASAPDRAAWKLVPEEAVRPGMSASIQVFLSGGSGSATPAEDEMGLREDRTPWLVIGGERYPLYVAAESERSGTAYLSPRFRWPRDSVELRLPHAVSQDEGGGIGARVYRWRSVASTSK